MQLDNLNIVDLLTVRVLCVIMRLGGGWRDRHLFIEGGAASAFKQNRRLARPGGG